MGTNNVYSPYGYRSTKASPTGTLGFTGQLFDAALEGYALGNGHRIYIPRLMRFISPDVLSPFLNGGINAYAYCLNDPINGQDPSGKSPAFKNFVQAALTAARSMRGAVSSAEGGLLANTQSKALAGEMMYAKLEVKAARIIYREIKSKGGFSQLDSSELHKFVFTKERKFVVFSGIDDKKMPSHASLGEYSGVGFGVRGLGEEAVGAGYVSVDEQGNISLNHHSGHFQSPFESLYPVEEHLNELGAQVTLIRLSFDFDM